MRQGGIKGAFDGKTAKRLKSLVDWLEAQLQLPIHVTTPAFIDPAPPSPPHSRHVTRKRSDTATCSQVLAATKNDETFRKPNTGMWAAMEKYTNGGVAVAADDSVYVGDMAGRPDGARGHVAAHVHRVGVEWRSTCPGRRGGTWHECRYPATRL